MISLLDILEEEKELGQREVDPETGVATIFRGQDPKTGKMSWDVENKTDMEFIHKKIKELILYMKDAKPGTKEEKIRRVLKHLSFSISKLY